MELLTHLPHGRAIDLGCGAGRNTLWLASRGWRVDAVDHSSVALTHAAATARSATRAIRERVRWVHADVSTITIPVGYDLALFSSLSMSLDNLEMPIRRAVEALEHEGFLAIVHNTFIPSNDMTPPVRDHEIRCTPDDLLGALPPGMTVMNSGTRPHPGGADALVLARKSTVGKRVNAE